MTPINTKKSRKTIVKAIVTLLKDNGYINGRVVRIPFENEFYKLTKYRKFKLFGDRLIYYNETYDMWFEVDKMSFTSIQPYLWLMSGIYECMVNRIED